MSQPVPYSRSYDFTQFSTDTPAAQPPGVRFDAEFDAIGLTTTQIRTNLALIQRDDGRLANGSVGLTTLDSDVLAAIAVAATPVTVWATATAYAVGRILIDSSDVYLVGIAHTSTSIAADLLSNKIVRIFDNGTLSGNVSAAYTSANPNDYGWLLSATAANKNLDGLRIEFSSSGASGSGYALHGIMTAGIGVVAGGGGGFAANGPGTVNGIVGNRYEDGAGSGGLLQRVGTGNGYGLTANFASSGTGAGAFILKQNTNGVAGGPSGLGPSAYIDNESEQGEAVTSVTAANDASIVSNSFTRNNITGGIIVRDLFIAHGARTQDLIGHDILLQPTGGNSTGTSNIYGQAITLTAAFTGAVETSGIQISNSAAGTNNYAGEFVVLGVGSLNTAVYAVASGSTNNRAANLQGDVVTSGHITPTGDNVKNLGGSGNRWATIYAGTGAINTSDARFKTWLASGLAAPYLRAARRIAALSGFYKWTEEVRKKGAGARIHFGSKAQDVIQIFIDEGLEAPIVQGQRPSFRHAFLCYDEFEDTYEPTLKKCFEKIERTRLVRTGKFAPPDLVTGHREPIREHVVQKLVKEVWRPVGKKMLVRKKGSLFGLRVDELNSFISAAQEARISLLEARLG